MSYLLDRKLKRKKIGILMLIVCAFIFIIYFRVTIFSGLSYASHAVLRPVLQLGNNIRANVGDISSFFYSKKILFLENESLISRLNDESAKVSNYNSVLDENFKLKEILNRKIPNRDLILSVILMKPNRSPYDTLVIDVGANQNVNVGDKVFANGNIPIGYIVSTFPASSKVVLFSSAGEKTEVIIPGKDIFMQIVGRGGGNFEMTLPRDFVIENGQEVHIPGVIPLVPAIVESVISDPRDSFLKVLLSSPVNIQELKFVQVEK